MSEPERLPDDVLPILVNGEARNADRFNTTLFTFIGEHAMYDHVFIQTTDEEEQPVHGAYIFKDVPLDNPTFSFLKTFVEKHDFPMILNMTRVPPCDRDAFFGGALNDLNNEEGVPEGWDDES